MFEGTTVALITPFDKKGSIDFDTVSKLAKWHLKSGTNAILVAGCTGESFTLDDSERLQIFDKVKEAVGNEISVLLGTGASSTEKALLRTRQAKDKGADAALVITPFGNKPGQNAMIDYFSKVADVGLPVILYNVPGRTGISIAPQTTVKLAEHPNIVAIKEASGSLDTVSYILANSDITVLSGDDSLTVPMMSLGASGVISTTANLLPKDFSRMVNFALEGNFKSSGDLHLKMFPVMKALFIESNPVPLKTAMAHAGIIPGEYFREPLKKIGEKNREFLNKVIDEYEMKS